MPQVLEDSPLPHYLDYEFWELPLVPGRQAVFVSGSAVIHYDDEGHWDIGRIHVDDECFRRKQFRGEADDAWWTIIAQALFRHRTNWIEDHVAIKLDMKGLIRSARENYA